MTWPLLLQVLAGALQDNKRATIVGENTFGKGLIQTIVELSDGSGIAITVARYQTPAGDIIWNERFRIWPCKEALSTSSHGYARRQHVGQTGRIRGDAKTVSATSAGNRVFPCSTLWQQNSLGYAYVCNSCMYLLVVSVPSRRGLNSVATLVFVGCCRGGYQQSRDYPRSQA